MRRPFIIASTLFILLAGITTSSFIAHRAYEEHVRNEALLTEIQSLEADSHLVERENHRLRDRIRYLQSDEFREREAKRVLEYQRSDERVVIVRDHTPERRQNESEENHQEMNDSEETTSSFAKWMQYFFGSGSQYHTKSNDHFLSL